MKYCLALGLMVLCVSARGQNAPVVFSVGVEDYPNFLPYSEYHNGEYRGLGRAIMDAFAEMDVRFAFPSRTVYVASLPPVKTSRHTALEAADANA